MPIHCPECNAENDPSADLCTTCLGRLKRLAVAAPLIAEPAFAGASAASFELALNRPTYSLFDKQGVALGTFFGGPLGGAVLLALNYSRLGASGQAAGAVMVGIVVTALLILLTSAIGSGLYLGGVLLVILARHVADSLQGIEVAQHTSRGGMIESAGRACLIGIGILAVLFVLLSAVLR